MGFMKLMRIYGNKKGLCGKISAKGLLFCDKVTEKYFHPGYNKHNKRKTERMKINVS